MSNFWIKQGDRKPSMESVLLDYLGQPVDLSNAVSAAFQMLNKETAVALIDHKTATIVAPSTEGRVRYLWDVGETDVEGDFAGSWRITWTGGEPQTYPTEGSIDVLIASSTGIVDGWPIGVIEQLRKMSGEVGETNYSDVDLARALTSRAGELAASAYDVYMLKAADASNLVNISESASSRSLGSLYKQYLDMADHWARQSRTIQAELTLESGRTARTRAIVRP